MRAGLLAAVLLTLQAVSASAAELRDVIVERNDDYYRLDSQAWFATSREALYAVLTNHDLFSQFTSAIIESRNVEPDEDGRPRFFSRMEGCVLLFCKSFVRYGHLVLHPLDEIVAVSHPEDSDFRLSRETWRLVPEGDGTLLIYQFEMIPDFWVPPVIGPYLMKRALKTGGEKAINRIEALALGKRPPK